MVGVIGTNLSAVDLLEGCIRRAREMCRHTYGVAPRVTVDGRLDATLAGVPEHIEYVLYELLKNALRAVAERAGYKMRPYKIVQQAIVRTPPASWTATGVSDSSSPPGCAGAMRCSGRPRRASAASTRGPWRRRRGSTTRRSGSCRR